MRFRNVADPNGAGITQCAAPRETGQLLFNSNCLLRAASKRARVGAQGDKDREGFVVVLFATIENATAVEHDVPRTRTRSYGFQPPRVQCVKIASRRKTTVIIFTVRVI